MNDTLNFYEILELDPSVSVDRQKGQIETTINTKKREWSRERRPGKRARAELARSSVQRMLDTLNSDPDLWRRHARERLKQINAKEAEAQKLYRDFCDVYGKKSISEDLIVNLDMLSGEQRDSRAILSSLGVSVDSPVAQEKTEAPSFGLTRLTRQNLERRLNGLGFEDLYMFLSDGADTAYDKRSSPEALRERCDAILEEVRKGRKTAEATLRQELAGLGLPLFKDAESKSKYDTSRSLESLVRYESFIMVFKKIGYIEPDQLDTLVGKAVRDSGESESTVRGCFKQRLEHHEVKTIEGATERRHVSICPYCGQSNKESVPRRRVAERAVGTVFRDPLKDGGEGPPMMVLPTGRFRMADLSGDGNDNERPVHTVTINRPIAMGRYPVTFKDYDRFVAATGAERPDGKGWGRGRRPVINVNWHDAKAYATWLSAQTGKTYRLPSESEWEYAARAGTETAYSWGDEIGVNRANGGGSGSKWSNRKTSPVGSFEPNAFGLYDMHGNVWEWVEDCWHNNYEGAPSDGSAWTGGGDSDLAVVRGGSWYDDPRFLRSAVRYWFRPSIRFNFLGFRLVQDLKPLILDACSLDP